MSLVFTLVAAGLGGWAARKLRWPAGAMIGAVVGVAVYNILLGPAYLPEEIALVIKIVSGMLIGSKVTKGDVLGLVRLVKPVILTIVVMLGFCMGVGWLLSLVCGYDLPTALLACAPGGIVDIAMISMDVQADAAVVSILQSVRLITVVGLFPALLSAVIRRLQPNLPQSPPRREEKQEAVKEAVSRRWKLRSFCITALVATACGLAGHLLRIPAGALTFSMIGCAVQNILWGNGYMPEPLKYVTQTLAGALIGAGITLSVVLELRFLLLPAALMLLGFFLVNLLLAYILHRWGGLDLPTAFFCCTPGGAAEISLMAEDLGANASQVSILQIIRSVSVIVAYPLLVSAL